MAAYQRSAGNPSEDDLRSVPAGAYGNMNDSLYATSGATPRGDLAEIPLSTLQTHQHHHQHHLQSMGGQYSPDDINPPARRVMHHSHDPADANADHYAHEATRHHADADDEDSDDDEHAGRNAPSTSLAGATGGVHATSNLPGTGKWSDQYGTLIGSKPEYDEKHPAMPFGKQPHLNGKDHSTPPSRPMSSAGVSSVDETDDFDWDTSSEDSDEEEKDRVIGPDGKKRIRAKRGRAIYLACIRLARPVRIMLFALVGTAIALVPFIVVISAFPRDPARAQVQVWSIWIAIIWAASCGTWLFVDWIPSLLMKLAIAVYGKSPQVFTFWIEVALAVALYVKLLGCITWAWISLGGILALQFAYADRPSYFVWIFRVLQALFASAVILLAEKILLQLVAINFHKTALADRLESNQKALKVLDKLYESKYEVPRSRGGWTSSHGWGRWGASASRPTSPGPNMPGGHAASKSREGYFRAAEVDDALRDAQNAEQQQQQQQHHHYHMSLHHHKKGQASEHDMAKAQRKANFATQLSDALQMATMKNSKLYRGRQGSNQSARKLAKKLFLNLSHHRKFLVADDFNPYFKDEQEAKEAFAVFDADKNGDISKTEMREAVQRIYKERRALSASLKDVSSAIAKLDSVMIFVGLIIAIFIWLLIFSPQSTISNLVPLSTFIVSFSFIFGNTLKTIFESMIFLFATHPYDSGDLVCVDDVWMFVKDFGLISTTFRTTTNEEIVAPNALLATSKYIHNARRSNAMWETTTVMCSFETALATIDEFRKRLRQYVKENDREWGGGLEINFDNVNQMNCINLVIAMEHKGNWQDWGARWARRTKLMREVKTIAEELGLEYSLPPQPITFQPRSGAAPFTPGRFTNLQRGSTQVRHGGMLHRGDDGVQLGPSSATGGRPGLTLRT